MRLFIGILVCLILFCHCKSHKNNTQVTSKYFVFTDSIRASELIIKDDVEGYFNSLSVADMSIQMKQKSPSLDREKSLLLFKNFIKTQVSNWSVSEKEVLGKSMEEAEKILKKIHPQILPKISLIKIKTGHFGDHVYYTRGNHICIPENIFKDYDPEINLPIILHEIFHIISKNNPSYRDKMYSLIEFEKLSSPPVLSEVLSKKLLTNPDGVTQQYFISLENEGQTKKVIPLITSKLKEFNPGFPNFFDYLEFDLFPVYFKNNTWYVECDAEGNTTLPLKSTPQFFTKIKDNTQYIIHPEEIMADNFMLAALYHHNGKGEKFSKDGKTLIEKVLSVTKSYPFRN
ncbi:MAG: hypothetical protein IPL20_06185 [Saprospiraceae bacterium]|nr:hypothetical protein [Saprospiraceae bacterium]